MPLIHISLDWPTFSDFPTDFGKVATFEWSYFGLHPVVHTLMGYLKDNSIALLCAAREFTALWLEKFYHTQPSVGIEYHEHAVAERTISLCFMYLVGSREGFDYRFQSRLAAAIFQHAQLLASESFYVRHQYVRFHNHGMFQDIALLLTAWVFPFCPCSSYWKHIAVQRLEAMFDSLYIEDGDGRISVENSFGYHINGSPMAAFISSMLENTNQLMKLIDLPKKIDNFSKVCSWTYNRFPAFGDTFRSSQTEQKALDASGINTERSLSLFRKAGYAVAKGMHEEASWKLVFIASCLSKTHKHCDNLSFSLFFDGVEWLIDPSFYNHEYKTGYAAYLRSAVAHNNLYIEGAEYSIDEGLASVDGMQNGDDFSISGAHRCYDGYVVERRISGRLEKLLMHIDDKISPMTDNVKMRLHCGEFVDVLQNEGELVLTHPASQYTLHIRAEDPYRVIEGKVDAPMGGIAGTTFCKTSTIKTVEFDIATGNIQWSISACLCS